MKKKNLSGLRAYDIALALDKGNNFCASFAGKDERIRHACNSGVGAVRLTLMNKSPSLEGISNENYHRAKSSAWRSCITAYKSHDKREACRGGAAIALRAIYDLEG